MKRDPSIHITKTNLKSILKDLMPTGTDIESLTLAIMRKSSSHSIHTRTISITNDKLDKKANKILKTSRQDADLFAQLIYAIRKTNRHKGISQIKPGSRDWDILKEITALALEFCNIYNLSRRDGFIKFIEIGLDKIKKFSLQKFLGLLEGISNTYEALIEISDDDEPEMTNELYSIYFRKILDTTGIPDDTKSIPEKYVWFVRARQEAKKLNISVKLYMEAQFSALDFARGIPHPTQLVGPKATDRVIRYIYQKGIKIKSARS